MRLARSYNLALSRLVNDDPAQAELLSAGIFATLVNVRQLQSDTEENGSWFNTLSTPPVGNFADTQFSHDRDWIVLAGLASAPCHWRLQDFIPFAPTDAPFYFTRQPIGRSINASSGLVVLNSFSAQSTLPPGLVIPGGHSLLVSSSVATTPLGVSLWVREA